MIVHEKQQEGNQGCTINKRVTIGDVYGFCRGAITSTLQYLADDVVSPGAPNGSPYCCFSAHALNVFVSRWQHASLTNQHDHKPDATANLESCINLTCRHVFHPMPITFIAPGHTALGIGIESTEPREIALAQRQLLELYNIDDSNTEGLKKCIDNVFATSYNSDNFQAVRQDHVSSHTVRA